MNFNLLESENRVQTPFIKVVIGNYTFGVYGKTQKNMRVEGIQYPNYIQKLNVKRINGTVNTYTLILKYAITENDDPNFFEKVFSSVSKTRKIKFSYGNLSMPSFCYKEEEALITNVGTSFDVSTASITYTVTAVSSANLMKAGNFTFKGGYYKPSDIIKDLILHNERYHLTDIFTGMRNLSRSDLNELIESNDEIVYIHDKTNISIYDYLSYLVASMQKLDTSTSEEPARNSVYSLFVVDEVSDKYDGPYFKVMNTSISSSDLGIYTVDVNMPSDSSQVVIGFNTNDNESYALLYDYSTDINSNLNAQRVNDKGELEYVYAPVISSKGDEHLTTAADRTWWTNVTEYPISGNLRMTGLLRTSMLMTHIKLNVYFYGRKHISTGTYIITEQDDEVSTSGFFTTLKLIRVKGDDVFGEVLNNIW